MNWQARYQDLANTSQDERLRTFYSAGLAAGIVNPSTLVHEVPLLVIDFETTGLNPITDGILSIGAVPMQLQRIQQSAARSWVVKPRRDLPSESVVIHGITHSDIQQAPDLNQILDELLPFLAGRLLVVHYSPIERPFLHQALLERIGEGIEFPVIDTMQLEARLHRSKSLTWWQRLRGQQPLSIRLSDSRMRYKLPWYHPHDAVTDAIATAELLQAQMAYHYQPSTTIGELWS